MPIVYVHGVNTRESLEYQKVIASRNAFFREIISPALSLSPENVKIYNPFWGDNGAKFAWNMAVLPRLDSEVEAFGQSEGRPENVILFDLIADYNLDASVSVIDNANMNFVGIIEIIYASAMAQTENEEDARNLARSYQRAAAYAEINSHPPWLCNSQDTNFIDQLENAISIDSQECFGSSRVVDALKEGLDRFVHILPKAGSIIAGNLFRKKLNSFVGCFAGDALTYVTQRGTRDNPGGITQIVLEALREAVANKTETDNKLIVIAHSFGGEIIYDILTFFDTELEIDCLITVGSQVGLFEEMKLYASSKPNIPPNPPEDKIQRPENLKRWLNVIDPNDVLSFQIEPVFAGTSDYVFETGYGAVRAHGGYFMRPSFYRRLATRLTEA